MAHFAELNSDSIVLRVVVVPDDQQQRGHEFLANDLGLGGTWIQTSYNTRAGQHEGGKTPLRKNFAGIGFKYDAQRDAFIPPKPFDSWTLNEQTCLWEAPVAMPASVRDPVTKRMKRYAWDEPTVSWVEVT